MDFFIAAYKQYGDFTGRANRQKYWMFYLFYVIFYILLGLAGAIVGVDAALASLFALASIIPSLAIGARRLHDTDRSGWWQLIILIPILGVIVLIFFLVQKGTQGENRFGADPLAENI